MHRGPDERARSSSSPLPQPAQHRPDIDRDRQQHRGGNDHHQREIDHRRSPQVSSSTSSIRPPRLRSMHRPVSKEVAKLADGHLRVVGERPFHLRFETSGAKRWHTGSWYAILINENEGQLFGVLAQATIATLDNDERNDRLGPKDHLFPVGTAAGTLDKPAVDDPAPRYRLVFSRRILACPASPDASCSAWIAVSARNAAIRSSSNF